MQDCIELLRSELTTEQHRAQEALVDKENVWSELLETRTAQSLEEMRMAVSKTSELSQ